MGAEAGIILVKDQVDLVPIDTSKNTVFRKMLLQFSLLGFSLIAK